MEPDQPTTIRYPNQCSVSLTDDDLLGDEIQPGNDLFGIVWINPARMSGAPCFAGTRVPVKSLVDHLNAGDCIETFLEDFPGVSLVQVTSLLARGGQGVLAGLLPTTRPADSADPA
jgi:uncharacterized protein (DUF433 family)